MGSEHNPPHFHVMYGGYNAVIDIRTLEMIEGDLPAKGLVMVKDWARQYQPELLDIWTTQNFRKLPPLE